MRYINLHLTFDIDCAEVSAHIMLLNTIMA